MFASTNQTKNPRGFSEVGENKQLLIANVVGSFNLCSNMLFLPHLQVQKLQSKDFLIGREQDYYSHNPNQHFSYQNHHI
ncbi:hypothetical protein DDV96_12150 [Marixanthomonas spongiae]|uniref:Uncharacterized protein n=1 Tax=Marixanthomonas spongiae TaxID=2174845 RepID=A0A2U0HYH8_9FLAO|nr:hypothetical protein DDV96_12150 [Marixanthomonas spongiae]